MLCLEAKKEGDDTEKSLVCCAVCLKRRVVDIGDGMEQLGFLSSYRCLLVGIWT